MIFEALYGSAQKGELLLLENGYCRFHVRRDRKLTILEIISLAKGTGKKLLNKIVELAKAKSVKAIVAKCPADLPANAWYQKNGFSLESAESTKTNRMVNKWVRQL